MAYYNPETGRTYLAMNMAPICRLTSPDERNFTCTICPIRKIQINHNLDFEKGCANVCLLYGDEVAEAFGYEKVIVDK